MMDDLTLAQYPHAHNPASLIRPLLLSLHYACHFSFGDYEKI
jgi:hypothetical protein